MHQHNFDIAVFYCIDPHLYLNYEVTPNIMENYLYWVLPQRRQDLIKVLLSSSKIVVVYALVCAFLSVTFWIIGKCKAIPYYDNFVANQMVVIAISLYQPIEKLPKKTWFRYLLIFCMLAFINLNVATQSWITSTLTHSSVRIPVRNIYELVDSDLSIMVHRDMIRQLTENLDEATANRLRRKVTHSSEPPTEMHLINHTDTAILISRVQLNYIRNLQDVHALYEASKTHLGGCVQIT